MPSPRTRLGAGALTLLLPLGLLAACDGGDPGSESDPSAPDGTAAALADALVAGDLGPVPLVDDDGAVIEAATATDDYATVVDGMGELEPTVELGEVEQDGDTATARLSWSWPVTPDEAWAYDSTVTLTRDPDDADSWRAVWEHAVVEPSLNAGAVLDLVPLAGARGDILGAGGAKLATLRPVVRVGIDKTQVSKKQAPASATELARLAEVEPGPFADEVKTAGDSAFVEAIVYREQDVPPALLSGFEAIKGARLIPDELPLAPTREFAAPVLGRVGEVTAEMIEDDPDRYAVGDEAGLSGLQAQYDEQLQGADGVAVQAVASDGKERDLFRVDPRDGKPLRITLDTSLQEEAEGLLADVGPASSIVAIQPSTGAVLAAANGPGNEGNNFAMTGQYAPGSTFKSVSALALLRRGVTPSTRVPCTPTVDVDGRDFKNYSDYPSSALGDIPFSVALANSCNTAFIAERTRLRNGDLAAAAASLGIGGDADLGYAAFLGQVDDGSTATEEGANMIGQGSILASPLAMATVVASIAEGSTVVPRLVDDVDVEPAADADPLTGAEAASLRDLLRGVVTSGSGSQLADVPGPPVIAKTGTAEYETDGEIRTRAWMIAAQGDLAVAVLVADGVSGATTAGPIMEAFLRAAR